MVSIVVSGFFLAAFCVIGWKAKNVEKEGGNGIRILFILGFSRKLVWFPVVIYNGLFHSMLNFVLISISYLLWSHLPAFESPLVSPLTSECTCNIRSPCGSLSPLHTFLLFWFTEQCHTINYEGIKSKVSTVLCLNKLLSASLEKKINT